jgi:pimeloyl-ACP methyl ester carboxylesterase
MGATPMIAPCTRGGSGLGEVRCDLEDATYTARGLTIHAVRQEGTDPTVVLLHGAAGNALSWLPLLDAFEGHRVVAVDMPGHGMTPPMTHWAPEPLAFALAEGIGAVHRGALVVGGHSWGGKVAALIAASHPESTRGLLLVDPAPSAPLPISPEEFVDATFRSESGPWDSIEHATAAVRGLPQYQRWTHHLERAFLRGLERTADGSVRARARREWLVGIAAASFTRDSAATGRVRCPTLLAMAEQSLVWQEPTNVVSLPNAERVVITSNHWILADNPTELGAVVRRWIGVLLA